MIQGFVEALRPFQVRGWVTDKLAPSARLRVRVSVDGRMVGTGDANLFREDLLAAQIGDGKHGFVINVTEILPLQRVHAILVEAITEDECALRIPAFSGLVIDAVEVYAAEALPETSVTGYFAAQPSVVSGWAYDSARPEKHLEVVVKVEGRQIGRSRADVFKEDLVVAGIGTGDHGFILPIPPNEQPLNVEMITVFALADNGRIVPLGIAVKPATLPPTSPGPAFPAPHVDLEQRPVIILGAARSGTSAIAQALISTGSYAGFEEGHLLDLLTPLMRATEQFYKNRSEEWSVGRSTHLRSVPQSFVEQGLKHVILQSARLTFPEGRWLDKTPRSGMIAAAPSLRTIWPNARFIYMRRRAVENLESRLRKFPGLDFEAHCREWALSIRNWHAVARLLSGSAMEIDQIYMAAYPEKVAAAVCNFLELPERSVPRVSAALSVDQPERTAAAFGSVTDISSLTWSSHKLETFRAICGPAMRMAGYGNDMTYFLDGAATNGIVMP